MRWLASLPGLLAGLTLSVALWAWLGRSVPLPDLPSGPLQCLSYAPTSAAGSPLTMRDGTFDVPPGLINADLDALAKVTGCLRSYSMLGAQGDVLAAAAVRGMQMHVGIWIGADDKRNAREIERTLALAHRYPAAVRSIVVGNEVLLRREMSGERLAGIIRSVKARTKLPVAYADIFEFWRRNPVVAEAADVMLVHVLPYWDDPHPVSIDDVQAHVRGIIARARETLPPKPLVIGEIGWPSEGRTRSRAHPSSVNQARFVREFAASAESLGVSYNLIEAIDQPWKHVPEGTVGGAWGMLDAQRRLKFPLTGPVDPWPLWRWAAGFTMGAVLVAFALAVGTRQTAAWWRWLGFGIAAGLGGAALWAAGEQIVAMCQGWREWAWGIALLGMAASGTALLLRALLPGGSSWLTSAWPGGRVTGVRLVPRSLSEVVGLLHGSVLSTAAIVALQLAVDGRHR
ncbi:MAG TPA: hypothetical protein VF678_10220, partial [bacterium]